MTGNILPSVALPLTRPQPKIPGGLAAGCVGSWCEIVKHRKITKVIGRSLVQSNEAVFVYLFPYAALSPACQHLHDMNASALIKVNESETRPLKFAGFN